MPSSGETNFRIGRNPSEVSPGRPNRRFIARLLEGRGFRNSYLSRKRYSAFRGKFTLLIGSDLLVAPLVFRPQYNHIIYPLPATEHLAMMVLLNFSSTSCGGACGEREVRTDRHSHLPCATI